MTSRRRPGPDFFSCPRPLTPPPPESDDTPVFPVAGHGPGIRWMPKRFDDPSCSIVCTSEGLLKISGSNEAKPHHVLLLSVDLGATWNPLAIPPFELRFGFAFLACQLDVFVIGGCVYSSESCVSEIWHSSDGGRSWASFDAPFEPRMYPQAAISFPFRNDLKPTVVIGGGLVETDDLNYTVKTFSDIWVSKDKGQHWTNTSQSAHGLACLSFNGSRLYGIFGNISNFSDDFGANWTGTNEESGYYFGNRFFASESGFYLLHAADSSRIPLSRFSPSPKLFDFYYLEKLRVIYAFERGTLTGNKRAWYSSVDSKLEQRDDSIADLIKRKTGISGDPWGRVLEYLAQ